MVHRTNTSQGRKPDSNRPLASPLPADQVEPPCLRAALAYLARGWSVIPLCSSSCPGHVSSRHSHPPERAGKLPLTAWKDWQSRLPTPGLVRQWWKDWPDANVAVLFGRVSGLVGVDIDNAEGMDLLVKLLGGEPPETLEFATGGGGRRLLYAWSPHQPMPIRHFGTGKRPLSFLAGGAYTVMPPSGHYSGREYAWPVEGGPDKVEIAPAPLALVAALENDHDKKKTTRGVNGSASGKGDGSRDWQDRAKAYCDKCPPAISGQGGHVQTLKVATGLVRSLGLDFHQALEALEAWYNPRCKPRWAAHELAHKARDAWERFGGCRADQTSRDTLASERTGIGSTRGIVVQPRFDQVGGAPSAPSAPSAILEANKMDRDRANGKDSLPSRSHTVVSSPAMPVAPPAPPSPPGRLASEIKPLAVTWFWEPYIPRGMLTLLTGAPGSGKSTLGADLMNRAGFTILFAGREESLEHSTIPRLIAAGVDLNKVLVIDQAGWFLPDCQERLTNLVREYKADLLLWDPISSYFPPEWSDNNGQHVRAVLEAANAIARDAGAATLGIRHPGKAPANPLPGSREWGAVPRVVIELRVDQGPPVVRWLRLVKYSLGPALETREFKLVGRPGQLAVFELGQVVSAADVVAAQAHTDPIDRTLLDDACDLIRGMLAAGRMEGSAILEAGRREGISPRTMQAAKGKLGVGHKREGSGRDHKVFWALPD